LFEIYNLHNFLSRHTPPTNLESEKICKISSYDYVKHVPPEQFAIPSPPTTLPS